MYLFLMSWDGLPFIIRDAIDQKVWLGYQKSLKVTTKFGAMTRIKIKIDK